METVAEKSSYRKSSKTLDFIERMGNKLPHPFILFLYLIGGLMGISLIMSLMGVNVVNPATNESVIVNNIISKDGLIWILTNALSNFSNFAPLGLVLAMQMGIGFSEQVGMLPAFMKKAILGVPVWALSATIIFLGINGSIASEASIIIIPALAATAFQALGKNPLAGLVAAYAATNAGFTASVIIAGTDVLLAGITQEATKIVDPNFLVNPAMNWYFMIASTVVLTVVGVWVNNKVITPRLGEYKGERFKGEQKVTELESKGLRNAGIASIIFFIILAIMVIPKTGILRDPDQGTIIPSPFLNGLVPIIIFYFIIISIVYGKTVGSLKSINEMPNMMADSLKPLMSYIVLVLAISQFIALFNYTNIGMIIAVKGAEFLQNAGFTGIPLVLFMVLFTSVINLFMSSGVAKWSIFASIFVPMLMLMGYSPALAQIVYRIGDSVTNPITPIYAYLPIIIGMAQKYDKEAGMGTIISLMLPYSMAFLGVWVVQLIIWIVFNLPLGPGANILI